MASTSMSIPAGLVQGRRDELEDVVDRTSTSSLGTKLMASTTGAIMTASLSELKLYEVDVYFDLL